MRIPSISRNFASFRLLWYMLGSTDDKRRMNVAKMGYAGGRLAAQAIAGKGEFLHPPPNVTAEYVRLWKVTVEDYPPGHFREGDRVILESFIDLSLTLRQMQEDMRTEPHMVDTPQGVKENPLLGSITKVSGRLTSMARSLRLTPSGRMQETQTPRKSRLAEDAAPGAGTASDDGIRLVS